MDFEQLELNLYGAGYREPRGKRGSRPHLADRQIGLTPEQMYWAVVDSAEFVAAAADTRRTRKGIGRLMRRDAMLLARHLPERKLLEEWLQRGMNYRPRMGEPMGTIPEPPKPLMF